MRLFRRPTDRCVPRGGGGKSKKSIYSAKFGISTLIDRLFRLNRPLLLFFKAFFGLKCTSKSKIEHTKCIQLYRKSLPSSYPYGQLASFIFDILRQDYPKRALPTLSACFQIIPYPWQKSFLLSTLLTLGQKSRSPPAPLKIYFIIYTP